MTENFNNISGRQIKGMCGMRLRYGHGVILSVKCFFLSIHWQNHKHYKLPQAVNQFLNQEANEEDFENQESSEDDSTEEERSEILEEDNINDT